MKTLVIAEPGCTHEGDFDTIFRLIQTAAACGADVFKNQWTSDPAQMCERRHIGTDHPKRSYYERAYTWLAFPVEWHTSFRARCHVLRMQYACSVYLPQDVATLDPFVDYHKVSSFEARDPAMLVAHRLFSKSGVFVSTGMCQSDEMSLLGKGWTALPGRRRVHFLHCVSSYPTPLESLHLRTHVGYQRQRGLDGLSDHSRHLLTGAVAVASGHRTIETHYRLDSCKPENPDYAVAFTPTEFTQYVKNIRDAELMLGDGVKRVQECERDMLPYRVTA